MDPLYSVDFAEFVVDVAVAVFWFLVLLVARAGHVLPLSDACVWLQLRYSTVICIAIEVGICPKEDRICERFHKCRVLDDWISEFLALSDEDDGFRISVSARGLLRMVG